MRRSLTTTFAVGLSALAALPLAAQSTVTLTGATAPNAGQVTAFGYYMSPYSGTVDAGPTLRFNCVDFFHDINIGDSWSANVINIGTAITGVASQTLSQSALALTRNGESGQHANTNTGLLDVLKIYEAAAWLTAQIPTNPASNPDESTAIQSAIWYVASEYGTGDPTHDYSELSNQYWNNGQTNSLVNSGLGSTGYWVDQATTFANNNTYNTAYYSQFNILAPTSGVGQEFIYSTPEPATLLLMATGLVGVFGLARRRRRDAIDVAESIVS